MNVFLCVRNGCTVCFSVSGMGMLHCFRNGYAGGQVPRRPGERQRDGYRARGPGSGSSRYVSRPTHLMLSLQPALGHWVLGSEKTVFTQSEM